MCPPGWDRVNWSVKNWRGWSPLSPPACDSPESYIWMVPKVIKKVSVKYKDFEFTGSLAWLLCHSELNHIDNRLLHNLSRLSFINYDALNDACIHQKFCNEKNHLEVILESHFSRKPINQICKVDLECNIKG